MKIARQLAYFAAHQAERPTLDGNLTLSLTFCPPDKRRRDLDNLVASCKPSIDGICEAWGIDDSHIKAHNVIWGAVVKGGEVRVSLGSPTAETKV